MSRISVGEFQKAGSGQEGDFTISWVLSAAAQVVNTYCMHSFERSIPICCTCAHKIKLVAEEQSSYGNSPMTSIEYLTLDMLGSIVSH